MREQELDRDLPIGFDGPIWRIFYWAMGYGDRRWYWVTDPDRPHADSALAQVGDFIRDRDGNVLRVQEIIHLGDEVHVYTRRVWHTILSDPSRLHDGSFFASCAPVRGVFLPKRRYKALCEYPHLYTLPPILKPIPEPVELPTEVTVQYSVLPDSEPPLVQASWGTPWIEHVPEERIGYLKTVVIQAAGVTTALIFALLMQVLFWPH